MFTDINCLQACKHHTTSCRRYIYSRKLRILKLPFLQVQVAKYLVNHYKVRMSDVVILTPYREQRSKISELLKGAYEDIQVTTVIKSQGTEFLNTFIQGELWKSAWPLSLRQTLTFPSLDRKSAFSLRCCYAYLLFFKDAYFFVRPSFVLSDGLGDCAPNSPI